MEKTVSIIICTYKNVEGLKNVILCLCRQLRKPDEIIIVQGGSESAIDEFLQNLLRSEKNIDIKVVKAELSLIRQRNAGLREANGDIIVFLDDDVSFDKLYIANLLSEYNKFWSENLGGIQGTIIEVENSSIFSLKNIFRRIFLQTAIGKNGLLQKSGNPLFCNKVSYTKQVEVFNGCHMSFRAESIKDEYFDDYFSKYWAFDDVEFSYRISKKYKLYQTDKAKLHHLSTTSRNESMDKLFFMRVINHNYLFKKYLSYKNINKIFYHYSMFGLFLLSVYKSINLFSAKPLKGYIRGIYALKKGFIYKIENR